MSSDSGKAVSKIGGQLGRNECAQRLFELSSEEINKATDNRRKQGRM